jgi:6-phosphogluconate dehydrogenase
MNKSNWLQVATWSRRSGVAEVCGVAASSPSWLLGLTTDALANDSNLLQFAGRVSDSGEGQWTIKAAIDEGVPVLTTAF